MMVQSTDDALQLPELVQYLRLPPHVLDRLAERRVVPAVRAGGRWRFSRREVDRWLDLGMPGWSEGELRAAAGALPAGGPALAGALRTNNVWLDLPARDARDCFERVVASLSLPSGVDRVVLLQRLVQREALCSTALDDGFAIPHTLREGPRLVPENVVGFARALRPIAFGAREGTDLFFFMFAADQDAHLALLSKVVTLVKFPHMARLLRAAKTGEEVVAEVGRIEQWLFHAELQEE